MHPIDKTRARLSFERAAADYDRVAVLQREIADRLLGRLDYIRLAPQRILDLGTGTGYAIDPLTRRYPRARVLALDFAQGMLSRHAGADAGGVARCASAPMPSRCRWPMVW